jgi:acetyl esterase
MPVDPQVQVLLDQLAAMGGPALDEQSPSQAREMFKGMALLDGEPETVSRLEDRTVPTPDGDVPVRVYRPGDAGETDVLPVLVWYHGGGWVIGDLDTTDATCRKLANRTGAVVVSVDYRLAPEHRFPAAAEDCWAVTTWIADHAAELGADASRMAVGGDSAGGNLAAVVAQRAVRTGSPVLRHQLLVYPVTDLTLGHPSIDENADGYLLTKAAMVWFTDHYLGPDGDAKHPHASPLHAEDVAGVAPATILTAEFDPLRDEGEAYGAMLREAGVEVDVRRYDGMIHGFFSLGAVVDRSREALDDAAATVRDALA